MRKIIAALALSALALCGASAVEAKDKQTGEEKLAKLLDGRVAGDPKSCIYTGRSSDMQVIDNTAIVYKDGSTIWVNRTAHPESLDRSDIQRPCMSQGPRESAAAFGELETTWVGVQPRTPARHAAALVHGQCGQTRTIRADDDPQQYRPSIGRPAPHARAYRAHGDDCEVVGGPPARRGEPGVRPSLDKSSAPGHRL